MGAHAYIEAEDLGLTVLGTIQTSYTVNGIHRQDYETAVFKATLCRTAALESALASYSQLVRVRQTKLQELGTALAALNAAFATKTSKTQTSDTLKVDPTAVSLLRRHGFTTAMVKMTYPDIMKMQQNVQYTMDREDNDMQQDMTMLQNFVSKRDDTMQMVTKLLKKAGSSRMTTIRNIGS